MSDNSKELAGQQREILRRVRHVDLGSEAITQRGETVNVVVLIRHAHLLTYQSIANEVVVFTRETTSPVTAGRAWSRAPLPRCELQV